MALNTGMTLDKDDAFELTPKQLQAIKLIGSDARHILLRGGSRSGKTFLLIRTIINRALMAPHSRHGIFRRYSTSARASIWKLTLPEVLRVCFPDLQGKVELNETEMRLTLPNKAVIVVGGLDDAERVQKILGLEFVTIYLNESSEIAWDSVSTVMTRLSQRVLVDVGKNKGQPMRPKFLADMNPQGTRHWTYQLFMQKLKPGTTEPVPNPDDWAEIQINPIDNLKNIDAAYLETLQNLSAKERKRFLDGEWQPDVEGALFSQDDIDARRIVADSLPTLKRIVVAVDPPATSGAKADECGIVVAGLGEDGRCYVLQDASQKGTPQVWGRAAIDAYHRWNADRLVAERNNGGEMIESILRTIDPHVSYKALWSSKGKASRAEPVSSLYERGEVSHVGEFKILESQLTSLTTGFSVRAAGYSPDRADALVFAVTELMLAKSQGASVIKIKAWG